MNRIVWELSDLNRALLECIFNKSNHLLNFSSMKLKLREKSIKREKKWLMGLMLNENFILEFKTPSSKKNSFFLTWNALKAIVCKYLLKQACIVLKICLTTCYGHYTRWSVYRAAFMQKKTHTHTSMLMPLTLQYEWHVSACLSIRPGDTEQHQHEMPYL